MTKHAQDQHPHEDRLVKLGDTKLVLSDPSDDIRDRTVIDPDGDEIGNVSAVHICKEESKIRFLQLGVGDFLGLGERQFLVPVEDVTRVTENVVHINSTVSMS